MRAWCRIQRCVVNAPCGMRTLMKSGRSCTVSGSRVRPHEASALAGPGQESTGPMSPHVFGCSLILCTLVHIGFHLGSCAFARVAADMTLSCLAECLCTTGYCSVLDLC